MNVSERQVYKALRVMRLAESLDRPDIPAAAEAGRMSLDEALRQLEGKRKPTRYERAVAAFNRLNEDEKGRFIAALRAALDATGQGGG